MNTQGTTDGLGSLTQAARSKELSSARTILYFVGVMTLIANGVFFFLAEKMVDDEFEKEISNLRRQGMVVEESAVEEARVGAVAATKLINGVGMALGVAFIVLGARVKKSPVPMTITGLVLYIGSAAVFGFLDPTTLARGLIIKILIVVGLFKAVQAAVAYEKEMKADAMVPSVEPGE